MNSVVILAAGASVRMGSPKALLDLAGTTFLERVIAASRAAAIDHIMVAVAHDDVKILKTNALRDVDVVINAATPVAVPLGSIQAAISRVINQKVDSLLVWPVDQPHVASSTASAIITAFLRSRKPIVLPTFDGRRGHPVLFARPVFPELLSAPASEGARAVVRADPSRVLELAVSDPAVVEDINTTAAYQDLLRRFAP